MYIDRIDLILPDADIESIVAELLSAEVKLHPLPPVATADRKRMAKLGLKNEGLARQIIEVGRANPDLIPRGIDFEKIDRDLAAREQLRTLKTLLERLLGKVTDAMLLCGVDIYAAALAIYHCLRRNADTASVRESVEELKKGFARPTRRKKEEETRDAAPDVASEPVEMPSPHPVATVQEVTSAANTSVQHKAAAEVVAGQHSAAPAPPRPPATWPVFLPQEVVQSSPGWVVPVPALVKPVGLREERAHTTGSKFQ